LRHGRPPISKPARYIALIVGIVVRVCSCSPSRTLFKDIDKEIVARTSDLEALKKKVCRKARSRRAVSHSSRGAERFETELQRLLRILPTAKQDTS